MQDVAAEVEGLGREERRARLLALVEEEGRELDLHTTMSTTIVDEVVGAFEDAYEVDVALYRAGSDTLVRRLVEEHEAGFPGADVVESSGPDLLALSREGLLVPYDSDVEGELLESALHEDWTADRFTASVLNWNTELVSEGGEPRAWEDLADPKWDGQLGLDSDDVDWFKTLWERWLADGRSQEEVQALWEAIAGGARVIRGHTLMAQLAAAGEVAVTVNFGHTVQQLIDAGAPLAFAPEPSVVRADGGALVSGGGHPAAALLFADWLLSEAQPLLAEVHTEPVRRDLASEATARALVVDVEDLAARQEEWVARFEELLQLAETVEAGG